MNKWQCEYSSLTDVCSEMMHSLTSILYNKQGILFALLEEKVKECGGQRLHSLSIRSVQKELGILQFLYSNLNCNFTKYLFLIFTQGYKWVPTRVEVDNVYDKATSAI